MSELNKLEGIVLRTHASGDSDLVLRILTRDEGKIAVLARRNRANRRNAVGSIDLFDCGEFELGRGRGPLQLVKEFAPSSAMHHLRETLDLLTLGSVVCEIADFLHLEDAGPQPEGFEALHTCLISLSARATLRENCAVVFAALGTLLGGAGFLDTTTLGRGSRDALVLLMLQVERATDRELRSKASLLDLARRL